MKNAIWMRALATAFALFAADVSLAQSAPEQGVTSLRGADAATETPVNPVYHQEEGRLERNYRLQPPLIPHTIDKYQIDLTANECLACHDWKRAADRGAPTLSMTHYVTRDSVQTDEVAPRRWFCNACHVPQANAPTLVDNLFKGSDE